jgi:hypothetical protein
MIDSIYRGGIIFSEQLVSANNHSRLTHLQTEVPTLKWSNIQAVQERPKILYAAYNPYLQVLRLENSFPRTHLEITHRVRKILTYLRLVQKFTQTHPRLQPSFPSFPIFKRHIIAEVFSLIPTPRKTNQPIDFHKVKRLYHIIQETNQLIRVS